MGFLAVLQNSDRYNRLANKFNRKKSNFLLKRRKTMNISLYSIPIEIHGNERKEKLRVKVYSNLFNLQGESQDRKNISSSKRLM